MELHDEEGHLLQDGVVDGDDGDPPVVGMNGNLSKRLLLVHDQSSQWRGPTSVPESPDVADDLVEAGHF